MQDYFQSMKDSYYSMISQKISQKMDSLPQIDHVSQRWIWQLIQNAKDSDSQFGKIKIKIQIHDSRFKFYHNGSPFTIQNLNSLVSHYSAKEDQNKDDVETTGKYGTGFMTTYILSRKVLLECKVKSFPKIIQDNDNDQDSKKSSIENKDLIESKSEIKRRKIKAKQISQSEYYQNIRITLDRNYKSVPQLKQKIMKIAHQMEKQLTKAPKQTKYVRTEESFDTHFQYEIDQTAENHINEGIKSIRKLFPLALLFNKKLYSIQVINQSSKFKQIQAFKITRNVIQQRSPLTKGLFSIFTVLIQEEQKQQKVVRKQQYLFEQLSQTNSIIAFPIQIEDDSVSLLSFKEGFPKIFKEFPLIGSQDTGFNFAFTSKQLYPSQNRKQLLLKTLEGRKGQKAEQNWKIINSIFTHANDTYILLATLIDKGKFNLFILPQENQFTKSPHQPRNFKSQIQKIKKNMFNSKVFHNEAGTKESIINFQIIYEEPITKQTYNSFNFLYKKNLLEDDFQQFCDYIQQNPDLHTKLMKKWVPKSFISLETCVDKLSKLTYKQYVKQFESQASALDHLQKIYRFLIKNRSKCFYSSLKSIILTQSLEFKCFYNDTQTLKLESDFTNKNELFQVADILNIPFRNQLIHSRFTQLFKLEILKSKTLKKQDRKAVCLLSINYSKLGILKKISMFFSQQINQSKTQQVAKDKILILLGRYMYTFSFIKPLQISMALNFKRFQSIGTPFCKQLIQYSKDINEGFLDIYYKCQKKLVQSAIKMYQASSNITQFSKNFINNDKSMATKYIYHLINQFSPETKYTPNADQQIINQRSIFLQPCRLKVLSQGFDYINAEDIEIFNRLYEKCNATFTLKYKLIHKMFVHPAVLKKDSDKRVYQKITFNELFSCIKNYYGQDTTKSEDKQLILNYTFKIYEEYIIKGNQSYKNKYLTFQKIIKDRHLELGKLLNTLDDHDKDLICKIFRMRDQFKELNELITDYSVGEALAILKKVKKTIK